MTFIRDIALSGACVAALALSAGQALAGPGDWTTIGGDAGQSKYSPLKQITAANVGTLKEAWKFPAGGSSLMPLVIDGVMFHTTGGKVYSLDAASGKLLWETSLATLVPLAPGGTALNAARSAQLPARGGPPGGAAATPAAATTAAPAVKYVPLGNNAKYGLAYWPGSGRIGPRVVLTTQGGYLIQLDAKTGKVITNFGVNGALDLRINAMEKMNATDYTPGMLPTIYKNLAIVAPRTDEQGRYGPPGDPRAFDLITGKEVWRFHTVPHPGEANFGGWGLNGWQDRRGPGSWVPMSVDYKNGLVFVATGNATDQDYGGTRPGDNLYATSLVALDGDTGKLRWYYQTTHHDIYDWDLNGAPALIEMTDKDGKKVEAVAQSAKQGYLFILDRLTGKAILPVEEKSQPASDAPGELTSPTQPTPHLEPIARVSLSRDEVANLSPASNKACLAIYDKVLNQGEGTPYGMVPSLVFPSSTGGPTWAGATFDPNLNYVFINTKSLGTIAMLTPQLSSNKFESLAKSKLPFSDPEGYPCSTPPWGELMAIDVGTGKFVWRQPLGEIKALTARGIPKTGTDNSGGSTATAGGVLFIGASQDRMFRAFDPKTGKELWSVEVSGNAGSTPVTYLGKNGKQYVTVSVGGRGGAVAGELVTFALP